MGFELIAGASTSESSRFEYRKIPFFSKITGRTSLINPVFCRDHPNTYL